MNFNQQWVCLCSLYFPIARPDLYSIENILLLSVATAMQCRTEYTWSKTCGEVHHVLKRLPCRRNVLCVQLDFLYGCPVSWNRLIHRYFDGFVQIRPLSRVEVKNGWSYNFQSLTCLHGWQKENFTPTDVKL